MTYDEWVRGCAPAGDALLRLRGNFGGLTVDRLMRMMTAFDQDVEIVMRPHAKAGEVGDFSFGLPLLNQADNIDNNGASRRLFISPNYLRYPAKGTRIPHILWKAGRACTRGLPVRSGQAIQREDEGDTVLSIGGLGMPKNSTGCRASVHISRKAAQNGFRAFDYAALVLGTGLNLNVVLHLRPTASASEATIFARVLHKFRDWHSRRLKQKGIDGGSGPIYVAVFENPGDQLPHVNWAVWVHPSLHREFRRKLLRWLTRSQDEEVRPFDLSVQSIDQASAKRLAKYLMKGVDPAFADHFHLRELAEEHGPQGTVYGRRVLISLALNTAARNGWKPPRGRRWGLKAAA